jgi:endoglycosylceramidase
VPRPSLRPLALTLSLGCAANPGGDAAGDVSTGDAGSGGPTSGDASGGPTTGEAPPAWPDACAEPVPAVARTDARLVADADGRLRDEHGRDVQLRGVNTGGRSKWAPFFPFPVAPGSTPDEFAAAADAFYARLPAWGVDTVRMPFSWEALEPAPGAWDDEYLERYAAQVDAAWAHGLRVIVDFHQDIYASPLCGDGFPPWTLPGEPGPPRHDCENWGFKYLVDPDVRGAFDRFWADEDDLQAKFFAMWARMIDRVGDHPGVVGLELLNEPGWGSAQDIPGWKQEVLDPFHTAALAELRARAGDGPLLLWNNLGIEAIPEAETTHLRPAGDGLMYAPHLYDSGLINGSPFSGTPPEPKLADIAAFAADAGVPALIGEFGVTDGAGGGDEWLARVLAAIDAHRLHATLWECSQNEELWNFEDLSVLDADGGERDILDTFVRPHLRALAGDDPEFTWDGAAGLARWTGDGGVSEISLPARRFPDGPKDLSLRTVSGPEGACLTEDRDRGELRVRVPDGARVEVAFSG